MFMRIFLFVILAMVADCVLAVEMSYRFRSPRNPERKVRASTELIVLHTTEAPANSSLNKLCDRGEAHFCVTEEGGVYAIVDRDREAFHAGRSMWCGKEDVDKFSIGIECVGYHNKRMPSVQLNAIRELVAQLKTMYRLTDEKVVCHSHVAYGAPNKWQKHRHRGRKRCGMLFAMPSVRRALGLKFRPAFDPDAKRLTVGDDYLRNVLYGSIDTMAPPAAPASKFAKSPVIANKKTAPKPVVKSAPKPAVKVVPKPTVKSKVNPAPTKKTTSKKK